MPYKSVKYETDPETGETVKLEASSRTDAARGNYVEVERKLPEHVEAAEKAAGTYTERPTPAPPGMQNAYMQTAGYGSSAINDAYMAAIQINAQSSLSYEDKIAQSDALYTAWQKSQDAYKYDGGSEKDIVDWWNEVGDQIRGTIENAPPTEPIIRPFDEITGTEYQSEAEREWYLNQIGKTVGLTGDPVWIAPPTPAGWKLSVYNEYVYEALVGQGYTVSDDGVYSPPAGSALTDADFEQGLRNIQYAYAAELAATEPTYWYDGAEWVPEVRPSIAPPAYNDKFGLEGYWFDGAEWVLEKSPEELEAALKAFYLLQMESQQILIQQYLANARAAKVDQQAPGTLRQIAIDTRAYDSPSALSQALDTVGGVIALPFSIDIPYADRVANAVGDVASYALEVAARSATGGPLVDIIDALNVPYVDDVLEVRRDIINFVGDVGEVVGESLVPQTVGDLVLEFIPGVGFVPDLARAGRKVTGGLIRRYADDVAQAIPSPHASGITPNPSESTGKSMAGVIDSPNASVGAQAIPAGAATPTPPDRLIAEAVDTLTSARIRAGSLPRLIAEGTSAGFSGAARAADEMVALAQNAFSSRGDDLTDAVRSRLDEPHPITVFDPPSATGTSRVPTPHSPQSSVSQLVQDLQRAASGMTPPTPSQIFAGTRLALQTGLPVAGVVLSATGADEELGLPPAALFALGMTGSGIPFDHRGTRRDGQLPFIGRKNKFSPWYSFEGIEDTQVRYTKRLDRKEYSSLRKEFKRKYGPRENFVKMVANDPQKIPVLISVFDLTLKELRVMQAIGQTPRRIEIHHRMPLDDLGTNHRSNLVIISGEVHDAITAAHLSRTSHINPGESIIINLPIVKGWIYPTEQGLIRSIE